MVQQMPPLVYEINDVRHAYGRKPTLRIDHLTISTGSIVGLIGPNGSGKSTLLRLLGLIEKPDQGEIRYKGQWALPFSPARFDVALLPQEPFLMKRSVFQNVCFGLHLRNDKADAVLRVREALALTGLSGEDFLKRPWYALSVGEMQRVAMAARLALRPAVLLLDEPTASVDAASASLIKNAARKARQDWGTTLIIASHDRQWLDDVCDRLLHLHKGEILGTGRETLVFGPWKEWGNGLWGKKLPDGQILGIPEPPEQNATALVNDFSISLTGIAKDSGAGVLCGTISRLAWRKSAGLIAAAVTAGDIWFFIDLTENQVKDQRLIPGKEVFIHYHPSKIKWV